MGPWQKKAQRAIDETKYHGEAERQALMHVIGYDPAEPYHTVKGFIEKVLAREEGWKPPYYEAPKAETVLDCLTLRWEIEIVNRTLDERMAFDGWSDPEARALKVIEEMTRHHPPEMIADLWGHHLQNKMFDRENRLQDRYLNTLYNEGMRMVGQLAAAHDLLGIPWNWARPPQASEFRRRAGAFLEEMGLLENGGWI